MRGEGRKSPKGGLMAAGSQAWCRRQTNNHHDGTIWSMVPVLNTLITHQWVLDDDWLRANAVHTEQIVAMSALQTKILSCNNIILRPSFINIILPYNQG